MFKNRVTLVINSRMYTMVSDETVEYMQKLADHINEKVDIIRKYSSNTLGERPIILAALNICDEYYKALSGSTSTEIEKIQAEMNELVNENKHLHQLLNESQFELDIQVMQDKFAELMKRNEELNKQLEYQTQQKTRDIAALKEEHKRELNKIREEYTKREKEILDSVGIQ